MEREFIDELKASVMDKLNDKDNVKEIEIKEVTKNNSQVCTGMVFKNDSNIAPIIYFDDMYKDFNNGTPIDDLAERMVNSYRDSQNVGKIDMDQFFDFDKVKDKIFVCARNAEKNSEQLKDVPHEIKNDVAIMYKIEVQRNGEGLGAVTITDDLMKQYGVDINDISNIAWENTKRMYPVDFNDMTDVLKRMMFPDGFPVGDDMMDMMEEHRGEMYVLTNSFGVNGAVYAFDNDVLKDISEKIGDTNLIILPSSINEVIILPQKNVESKESLRGIVGEVNQSDAVPESDFLSNNIYCYDRLKNELVTFVPEQEMQMGEM